MSEHIGEWHAVTATDITPEGDDEIDLGIEVTHLDTCPVETGDDFSGNAWTWTVCDLGTEISAAGYDGFGITEPGTYRARFRPSCDYFGEWDGEVQVEQVAS